VLLSPPETATVCATTLPPDSCAPADVSARVRNQRSHGHVRDEIRGPPTTSIRSSRSTPDECWVSAGYARIDGIARAEGGRASGIRRRLEPPIGPVPDAPCGARQAPADCQRRLDRYRAALAAGTDPAIVQQWIAEVTATRAAAEAQLRDSRTAPEGSPLSRSEHSSSRPVGGARHQWRLGPQPPHRSGSGGAR
jgi:hypothetical protein